MSETGSEKDLPEESTLVRRREVQEQYFEPETASQNGLGPNHPRVAAPLYTR
jgi:hypothetical protein